MLKKKFFSVINKLKYRKSKQNSPLKSHLKSNINTITCVLVAGAKEVSVGAL